MLRRCVLARTRGLPFLGRPAGGGPAGGLTGYFGPGRRFTEAETPLHERAEIAKSLQYIDKSLRGLTFWTIGVTVSFPIIGYALYKKD